MKEKEEEEEQQAGLALQLRSEWEGIRRDYVASTGKRATERGPENYNHLDRAGTRPTEGQYVDTVNGLSED